MKRSHRQRGVGHALGRSAVLAVALAAMPALAQFTSSDFSAIPPLITDSASPNVMLVMSNDHELYKKAYSDYSDLDGDGELETGYNDALTYAGYFDSNFCYSYDSGDGRYEPAADIRSQIAVNGHACNGAGVAGEWSGNFLNWATMTRMDMVRHVLYGGKRIIDTATSGGTAGVTVLERVFLPEDIHAFAKVFAGDTGRYTPYAQSSVTLCNVTMSGVAQPPLLRVAFGSWPQWSSSEVVQCHYRNEYNSNLGNQPTASDHPATYEYRVRVQACVDGMDASSSRCKAYVNSANDAVTYKPVGLLQEYGDGGNMNFGLMTGSYNEKISGGVLRKNILPLTGNAESSANEVDLDTGRFINQDADDAGIVNTLNRLRLVNWSYGNNNYSDCDHYDISLTTFKSSNQSNRQCRNWGNPLSEIYLEALRYFSGDEVPTAADGAGLPTAAFNTSDHLQVPSLPQLDWQDPLNEDSACATCSIIVLSTGLNSFDTDELASVDGLWDVAGSSRMSTTKLDALLDEIGDLEGITGNQFLIGENGGVNDGACTAKTIGSFAAARGLCPELPGLEGGFDIAALAWHARVTDLRDAYEGIQNVNTFSLALAESLPSFELDVNGETVSFVPTCQANIDGSAKLDEGGWRDCSLSNVVVESYSATSGSLLIAWEDARWGNDYDMDGIARLEWCIGDSVDGCPGQPANLWLGNSYSWSDDFAWKSGQGANAVQFRLSVPQAAAGNALRFGYIISGVEEPNLTTTLVTNTASAAIVASPSVNGSKYILRERLGNGEQALLLRQGGNTISRLNANSGNPIIYVEPAVYQASADVEAGALLKNPLWYTAKYGSFNDIDDDGTPQYLGGTSDTREWDARDTVGNDGPDGLPDNFFPIRNPANLRSSLNQVFGIILDRISSGTAAAVVANSSTGLGAVYQAYYHPTYTDPNNVSVSWGGVLHAMFIDDSGRFREDLGTPGTLDDVATDYVIDIFYDRTVNPNRTRYQRYLQTGSGDAITLTPVGGARELEEIGSVWNARNVLSNIPQNVVTEQRGLNGISGEFSEPAEGKRYIFTWLDGQAEGTAGTVDAGEVLDFTAANFDPDINDNWRYFGVPESDSAKVGDLVDWLRGKAVAGHRAREVDIPGDGSSDSKPWLLGDIVHSSPLVVSAPGEGYDIVYGDETYQAFREQYARRRQMIYVGANDGMLHAFNAGIWDTATRTFHTQGLDRASGQFNQGEAHALGAEMWAYVPMNLLPHLQWLKEENYPHVYYMDSPPQAFDVNIFADDDVHPNGWGTILVAGMRLGGGDFPVDLDGDGSDDRVMGSAYVILDITDPERPPELLAEIRLPGMGFTTSLPTVAKARVPSLEQSFRNPTRNEWMLLFGSGPDNISNGTSTGQDATLFAYDLVARQLVNLNASAQTPAGDPGGFFGDFLAVDWNNDYQDDAIYAGTIEGSEFAPSGRLKRLVLGEGTQFGLASGGAALSDVLNVARPVSARPVTQTDVARGERWLLFGTGRLFTRKDNLSTTQQGYYGLKEPAGYNTSSVATGDLVDTSDVLVETNGAIWDGAPEEQLTLKGTELDTFPELQDFMGGHPGWVRRLGYNGNDPSERVFTASLMLGDTVVFTAYEPSQDLCEVEGESFLYALNMRTGTAQPFAPIGQEGDFASARISLGQGASSAPFSIVSTGDAPRPDGGETGDMTLVSISSTAEPSASGFSAAPGLGGRMSWEILPIPF